MSHFFFSFFFFCTIPSKKFLFSFVGGFLIVGGLVALKFQKVLIILSTACGGANLIMQAIDYFADNGRSAALYESAFTSSVYKPSKFIIIIFKWTQIYYLSNLFQFAALTTFFLPFQSVAGRPTLSSPCGLCYSLQAASCSLRKQERIGIIVTELTSSSPMEVRGGKEENKTTNKTFLHTHTLSHFSHSLLSLLPSLLSLPLTCTHTPTPEMQPLEERDDISDFEEFNRQYPMQGRKGKKKTKKTFSPTSLQAIIFFPHKKAQREKFLILAFHFTTNHFIFLQACA